MENIHSEQTDTFAYFNSTAFVDDKEVFVRISVKKKAGSNHFHIHHIDVNEKSPELLGPSKETDIFEIQDSIVKLTDNQNFVNRIIKYCTLMNLAYIY